MRRRFCRLFIRWSIFLTLIYAVFLAYVLLHDLYDEVRVRRFQPTTLPLYSCPANGSDAESVTGSREHRTKPSSHAAKRSRILLITATNSTDYSDISAFLDYLKVPIRVESLGSEGPSHQWLLELAGVGRYSLIVFSDYRLYYNLTNETRESISRYCAEFGVGLISFLPSRGGDEEEDFGLFTISNGQYAHNMRFPRNSPIRHIGKADAARPFPGVYESDWALMRVHNNSAIVVLVEAEDYYGRTGATGILLQVSSHAEHVILSHDTLGDWMMRLALLDSLIYFNVTDPDLERFIQVDIDDVFVGQSGTRLTASDVLALKETQAELRSYIADFRFTLGFSGYFYRRGDERERRGDELLVENAMEFHWFPHMWRHNHAHEYSEEYLVALMTQNHHFAQVPSSMIMYSA